MAADGAFNCVAARTGARGRRRRAGSYGIRKLRINQRDRLDEWIIVSATVRAVYTGEHPSFSGAESAAKGGFAVA